MKFIDLFAGLGGFHIALKDEGLECVFASEIDTKLRSLYKKNFGMQCHGDITQIHETKIPEHNILCAGFPCQPFSKAGNQKGFSDVKSGEMIYEIIRVLKYHQPEYFILENVPNLKSHDHGKTWEIIQNLLEDCHYIVKDFILSPHHFGIPNNRNRVFIVGTHKKERSVMFDFKQEEKEIDDIKNFLKNNPTNAKKLSNQQLKCLSFWQRFIACLPKNKPLPKFPVWSMEFGANYPIDGKCPFYMTQEELSNYKGAFGRSLKGLPKKVQLEKLPVYATYKQKEFPKWKIKYIQKNRDFWQKNKTYIKSIINEVRIYPNSWQKLEWNAGDGERDIFKYLLQFRSSGIRVKSRASIPSLVLTRTQTPIISWEKRYLSLREAQELQGFKDISLPDMESFAFGALGNAVNTRVVSNIVKQIKLQKQKTEVIHLQSFTDNNQLPHVDTLSDICV